MKVMLLWVLRRALGLSLFLDLFYLIGNYMWGWPFPTPSVLIEIFISVILGLTLGAVFSKVWPLPPQKGFERVMRTLLIGIPSIGVGLGLNFILQGKVFTQALWMIFAIAAWLGSGFLVRTEAAAGKVRS